MIYTSWYLAAEAAEAEAQVLRNKKSSQYEDEFTPHLIMRREEMTGDGTSFDWD